MLHLPKRFVELNGRNWPSRRGAWGKGKALTFLLYQQHWAPGSDDREQAAAGSVRERVVEGRGPGGVGRGVEGGSLTAPTPLVCFLLLHWP